MNKSMEKFILIAADNVSKLRLIDVDRVLTEVPEKYRDKLAAYIIKNRPELEHEVNEVMQDLKIPF